MLLFLILLLPNVLPLLLNRTAITPIDIQIGSAYSLNITSFFRDFQYSYLKQYRSKRDQASSKTCYISVSKEGQLQLKSDIGYSRKQEGEKSEKWLEDRLVVNFAELLDMKTFSDAVYFSHRLYAFFTTNELAIYDFNTATGQLSKIQILILQAHPAVQAQFVQIGKQLFLISRYRAVRVNKNNTFDFLSEYNGSTDLITDLKVKENSLLIGLGEKGISTYDYNASEKSLTFVKSAQFAFKSQTEESQFSVDQFDIDTLTNTLYVLDYTEGLLEVPLAKMNQLTEIQSPTARLLVSGCSNIVVLPYSIYVTCPELIQIQRGNYRVQNIIHNSFYPEKMVYQQERLYLSSRDNFAIYDLFGKVIDEYELRIHGQESIVLAGYLVTFGMERVVSQLITPQQQALVCYSQEEGQYQGTIITEGICGQYNGTLPKEFPLNEICTYEEPISVTFNDNHPLDLKIELWLAIIWATSQVLIGIFLLVNHCLTIHKYQPLTEQDFKQLADLSKNQDAKEQSSGPKEMVLTE